MAKKKASLKNPEPEKEDHEHHAGEESKAHIMMQGEGTLRNDILHVEYTG